MSGFLPGKVFPSRGLMSSCRADMSDTLAWNSFTNFDMECTLHAKHTKTKRHDEVYIYIFYY